MGKDNKNNKDDKFYGFKIDKDKIKLQLKSLGDKIAGKKKRRKGIAILITFFLLVGVGIALYYNNDNNSQISIESVENRDQQAVEKGSDSSNNINQSLNLERDELQISSNRDKAVTKENVENTRDSEETGINKESREEETADVVTVPVKDIEQDSANRTARENMELLKPVSGNLIDEPGWYFHPVLEDWRYRPGIKIAGNTGDIVMSAKKGKVVDVKEDEYKGIIVKVKHDNNWQTLYGQLQKSTVSEGEIVGKGQEIGRIGQTGITNSPGLYFELINSKNEPVDPSNYLQ